jgi:hypothetical protein
VRCVFQDRACLGPGGEGAGGGEGGGDGSAGLEGVAGSECCGAAAVCGADEGAWCRCAADPAGVVGEEGVEPFWAEVGVFKAVGGVN